MVKLKPLLCIYVRERRGCMIFDGRPLYVLRLSTREHYRHTDRRGQRLPVAMSRKLDPIFPSPPCASAANLIVPALLPCDASVAKQKSLTGDAVAYISASSPPLGKVVLIFFNAKLR